MHTPHIFLDSFVCSRIVGYITDTLEFNFRLWYVFARHNLYYLEQLEQWIYHTKFC